MAKDKAFDALWERLEPLLPKKRRNRHVQYAGRKPAEARQALAGILFVLRTGIPWRSLRPTTRMRQTTSGDAPTSIQTEPLGIW